MCRYPSTEYEAISLEDAINLDTVINWNNKMDSRIKAITVVLVLL